jgi:hypothetical protein
MWKSFLKLFKRTFFMKYYVVTIDTTGRPNAKGFRPGIQNFYICIAPGEMEAKNLVLSTFRSNPNFLNQLLPCTSATPLESITKLLSPNQALWSYIPIGGVRAPGQQKLIPNPESIVQHNPIVNMESSKENFAPSSKQIAPPKTYEAQASLDMQEANRVAPGDTSDQLVKDQAKVIAALMAKLGMGDGNTTPAVDPEAAMRHSDEGSYDDDITALPKNVAPVPRNNPPGKVALPDQPPQGPIPGLLEPDQETMRRIRQNVKPVNFETID